MNSITKILLLTLLSFSQNYYFQIKSVQSLYEEYDLYVYENGKNLEYDTKDNEIFDKKDRKNVHFKKPDFTIDLSIFSKAQTNILNNLKVAEEYLRNLKNKNIIERLAIGVKDTDVYLGGLKEKDIGKYSDKISLDLVKDDNGYGFKINEINMIDPNKKNITKVDLSKNFKGLCIHADDINDNLIISPPSFFDYFQTLHYFKDCELVHRTLKFESPPRDPNYIDCENNEEIIKNVPDFTFNLGGYNFSPKEGNNFDEGYFYILKGNKKQPWVFPSGMCRSFVIDCDLDNMKVNIYFNPSEIKGYKVTKANTKNDGFNFNYLGMMFVLMILILGYYYKFNNKRKNVRSNESQGEELMTIDEI